MTPWVTVWAVSAEHFRWGNAGEGLIALSVLALGGAIFFGLRTRHLFAARAVVAVSAAVAAWYVGATVQHLLEHDACVTAERRGDGQVLEGVVTDLRPLGGAFGEGRDETFRVAGEEVRLPYLAEGCGYHRSRLESAPIREGQRVRLLVWNGQILKVDVTR